MKIIEIVAYQTCFLIISCHSSNLESRKPLFTRRTPLNPLNQNLYSKFFLPIPRLSEDHAQQRSDRTAHEEAHFGERVPRP